MVENHPSATHDKPGCVPPMQWNVLFSSTAVSVAYCEIPGVKTGQFRRKTLYDPCPSD